MDRARLIAEVQALLAVFRRAASRIGKHLHSNNDPARYERDFRGDEALARASGDGVAEVAEQSGVVDLHHCCCGDLFRVGSDAGGRAATSAF